MRWYFVEKWNMHKQGGLLKNNLVLTLKFPYLKDLIEGKKCPAAILVIVSAAGKNVEKNN